MYHRDFAIRFFITSIFCKTILRSLKSFIKRSSTLLILKYHPIVSNLADFYNSLTHKVSHMAYLIFAKHTELSQLGTNHNSKIHSKFTSIAGTIQCKVLKNIKPLQGPKYPQKSHQSITRKISLVKTYNSHFKNLIVLWSMDDCYKIYRVFCRFSSLFHLKILREMGGITTDLN